MCTCSCLIYLLLKSSSVNRVVSLTGMTRSPSLEVTCSDGNSSDPADSSLTSNRGYRSKIFCTSSNRSTMWSSEWSGRGMSGEVGERASPGAECEWSATEGRSCRKEVEFTCLGPREGSTPL